MLDQGLSQHLTWGLRPNHQEKVPRAIGQLGRYSGPAPMSSATQRKWQGYKRPAESTQRENLPPSFLQRSLLTDVPSLLTKTTLRHYSRDRGARKVLCILGRPHRHHAARNDLESTYFHFLNARIKGTHNNTPGLV